MAGRRRFRPRMAQERAARIRRNLRTSGQSRAGTSAVKPVPPVKAKGAT